MDKVIINKKLTQEEFFLDYINFLEGIKTHCKAMHWGIMNVEGVKSKRGAHIYLDDFLDIISDYQDMIAETTQGILGNYITLANIKGKSVPQGVADNPHDFCQWLQNNVVNFYNSLDIPAYVGIKSETETFIKDIQKYNCLFNFCIA